MTSCPRYTIAVAMYGRPFDFCQSTCDLVTSPVPPALSANALFFPSDMNFSIASHSSRVILPSLLASMVSKLSFRDVFWASSLEMAPSLSVSTFLSMASNEGIWNSLSSGPPGDQPAKNSVPSAATGVVQHPDGTPATDHFSSP